MPSFDDLIHQKRFTVRPVHALRMLLRSISARRRKPFGDCGAGGIPHPAGCIPIPGQAELLNIVPLRSATRFINASNVLLPAGWLPPLSH